MSWTDDRVELLKKMWGEGQSASQIAKELGGVTCNAVIGKVHRLGLSNRAGSGTAKTEAKPAEETKPVPQAHAHNDYYHQRPLLDALSHGFCSVEADIFLVDGKLLVGHSRSELKPNNTLERLYLDPLRARR